MRVLACGAPYLAVVRRWRILQAQPDGPCHGLGASEYHLGTKRGRWVVPQWRSPARLKLFALQANNVLHLSQHASDAVSQLRHYITRNGMLVNFGRTEFEIGHGSPPKGQRQDVLFYCAYYVRILGHL